MNKIIRGLVLILILISTLMVYGCNKDDSIEMPGSGFNSQLESASYPMALMWNDRQYEPTAKEPVDESLIDSELGQITRQVCPMPQNNGDINDTRDFAVGDKLFSIKGVEQTEAIAVKKEDKYYRIGKLTSSRWIVWNNGVYDFKNLLNENEEKNIGIQIGQIKGSRADIKDAGEGDIIVVGVESDASDFPVGSKIYNLKNTDSKNLIAVQDKTGKYMLAEYVKKLK